MLKKWPLALALVLPLSFVAGAWPAVGSRAPQPESALYFVLLSGAPSLSDDVGVSDGPQRLAAARRSQTSALSAARSLGGSVAFRYTRAVNAFSARLDSGAARRLLEHPDVVAVEPVPIVSAALTETVDHIGTKRAWADHGVRGKGVHVAVIDSGIDYTHAAFRGPGTVRAYERNDPTRIEGDSFPTTKVVAGHDFVGDDYDVLDGKTSNDTPKPDPDPLDPQGHGTHVADTCCGKRVRGIGKGVAPRAKLHAYKVWGHGGSSTADVLVAAYERALDPNQDGKLKDRVDVLNFSGGVYYGTPTSTESIAAQSLVDAGVTFVAAAGNSSGHAYRVGAPATAPGVIAVAATKTPNDVVAGFSSAGPGRGGHGLKPEVSAPGEFVQAAGAGTGAGSFSFSGTSMAAPHVSGAAALLVELHPTWGPDEIKSALVNHAERGVKARGERPGPALLTGAGLLRVDHAADAVSLAIPSTVSFGAPHIALGTELAGASFAIVNRDYVRHRYVLSTGTAYSSVEAGAASVTLSVDGDPPSEEISFSLDPGAARIVTPHLSLEPGLLGREAEVLSRYGRLPVIDGTIDVEQSSGGRDSFSLPWQVVPYVSSDISVTATTLDLSSGDAQIDFDVAPSAGTPAADVYALGDEDPSGDVALGEADIEAIGARSFTGAGLGDGTDEAPSGFDPYRGSSWLGAIGAPSIDEPVEVAFVTASPHETIETLRVRVLIDAGADGVFEDPGLEADVMVQKSSLSMEACVRELPLDGGGCSGDAGVDYDLFDGDLVGLVFDALDVGLTDGDSVFSYRVEVCSDTFSGDVADLRCDSSAGIGSDGTYPARLDVTDPAPLPAPPLCGGFWGGPDCRNGLELSGAPSDPDVLLLFPNNPPGETSALLRTP